MLVLNINAEGGADCGVAQLDLIFRERGTRMAIETSSTSMTLLYWLPAHATYLADIATYGTIIRHGDMFVSRLTSKQASILRLRITDTAFLATSSRLNSLYCAASMPYSSQ